MLRRDISVLRKESRTKSRQRARYREQRGAAGKSPRRLNSSRQARERVRAVGAWRGGHGMAGKAVSGPSAGARFCAAKGSRRGLRPRRGRGRKKKRPPAELSAGGRLVCKGRQPTLPHSCAVPSARAGLTSLFGMGRGGTPPP